MTLLAQASISVQDREGVPLTDVIIFDNSSLDYYQTDTSGRVELENSGLPSTFTVQADGYEFQTITLDPDQQLSIVLKSLSITIDEMTIIGRTEKPTDKILQQTEVLTAREINQVTNQSSVDILEKKANVYIQRSQHGGGSPVIRGLEANKILLVVDGVRLNNAIYRGGHLQNSITVGDQTLSQLEVIYGPGSLNYGSDALGGVIHFKTKSPIFDSPGRMSGSLLYGSSSHALRASLDWMQGGKNVASYTGVSVSKFGDLKTGALRNAAYKASPEYGLTPVYYDDQQLVENDDPLRQRHTGYDQIDLIQKIKWLTSEVSTLELNLQYSTSSNIPRYDQLAFAEEDGSFTWDIWNYGPQQRLLSALTYEYFQSKKIFDRSKTIVSYQKIEESRITSLVNDLVSETQREQLDIWNLTSDFSKSISKSINLDYGIDAQWQSIASSAFDDFNTEEAILTRYPDGENTVINSGIYLNLSKAFLNEALLLEAGTRYSLNKTNLGFVNRVIFQWPEYFYEGISIDNQALVGSGGLIFKNGFSTVKYAIASAFRAPNVDDLAKLRIKSDQISVPNPTIIPEKALGHDLSYRLKNKKLDWSVSSYFTRLKNLISNRPFALTNGDTTYTTQEGNTYAVTANQNLSQANIYGIQSSLNYQVNQWLTIDGRISWTEGRTLDEEKTPVDHIPPLFGSFSTEFKNGNYRGGVQWQYFGDKPLEEYGGSTDNLEYALPSGTPSYNLFHITNRYTIGDWTLGLNIENVFDLFYRPFASGVSGSGRNFVLSLRYQ